MLDALTLWGHLFAALLYGALAIFQLRRWKGDGRDRPLITAFAVMSVWTIFLSMLGPYALLTALTESARNLAFLAFMYGLMSGAGEGGGGRAVKAVYAAVAAVVGLQIVIGGVMPEFVRTPLVFAALASTAQVIGLTIAAGSLILVHNLYGQAAHQSRAALRFPMLALAGMWAYDLHFYTVAWFSREPAAELFALRGLVLAALVPLFALGMRRSEGWKVQLSRAATFQSVSLVAILGYLLLMMVATRAMELAGGEWARLGQIGIVALMSLGALLLLPSRRSRAWLRVFLAKHLFEHRYDYRAEWLRFTATVGRDGDDTASIEERVVKAMADIGGAPGGLLLLAEDGGRMTPAARWKWDAPLPPPCEGAGALIDFVAANGFVIELASLRGGWLAHGETRLPVPLSLAALDGAWAGVPLIHGGRLLGLVVLQHPVVRRALDWEDFDLFRTAGIQAASYIAEARSQQALADAERFDEFNRRFAFIMHDIKNLVSQLSLVARNAERHADNPAFREDMIATLQSSVKKMNDLLARLSPGAAREAEPARPIALQPLLAGLARAKRRHHPVTLSGEPHVCALADPVRLEQALGHLLQNAIDASPAHEPVLIRFAEGPEGASIEIEDHGCGMAPDFVRARLFQPFASTKPGGFGIGAHEARALVAAMGGRIQVESREGEGTRFIVTLPRAQAPAALLPERMRA